MLEITSYNTGSLVTVPELGLTSFWRSLPLLESGLIDRYVLTNTKPEAFYIVFAVIRPFSMNASIACSYITSFRCAFCFRFSRLTPDRTAEPFRAPAPVFRPLTARFPRRLAIPVSVRSRPPFIKPSIGIRYFRPRPLKIR